MQASPPTQDEE
jgi:hypothetical protein